MAELILFNPRSADYKPRIPNSILQIAATVEGRLNYAIVDGNMENDPTPAMMRWLKKGGVKFFGCTCMPGPQLKQALSMTKLVRAFDPSIHIIWGGYFPSNYPKVVLDSGLVDVIVNGPGDECFPELLQRLAHNNTYEDLPNLIFLRNGEMVKTKKAALPNQDALPNLPYDSLHRFYPLHKYLGKTYLGTRTIAYHSSIGCPFQCSFCAVVPIYEARWSGKSAQNIYKDIKYLKEQHGGNAIEFHDNNFFVSEKRVMEFSQLMRHEGMQWWGEGRIDTIARYSDETLKAMREAGCVMIFFGAESGDDAMLKQMNKGGTQTGKQILEFAARMKQFDIIPEYSFVLGTPADSEAEVLARLDKDITFIRSVKEANPSTEIIIYVYSPVPTAGSEMFNAVLNSGFRFPQTLEEWVQPAWEQFNLRKNPLTPWLTEKAIRKIRDFETVLNSYYPTVSDVKMNAFKRTVMKWISAVRYHTRYYHLPYELKFLQQFWKYRQPEIEGF